MQGGTEGTALCRAIAAVPAKLDLTGGYLLNHAVSPFHYNRDLKLHGGAGWRGGGSRVGLAADFVRTRVNIQVSKWERTAIGVGETTWT